MTIRTKLILCLALLTLALAVLGSASYVALGLTADKTRIIVAERVVPIKQLKVVADMYAVNIVDAAHKMRSGAFTWQEGRENLQKAYAEIETTWKQYSTAVVLPEEMELVHHVGAAISAAKEPGDELLRIVEARDSLGLSAFIDTRLYAAVDPISGPLSNLIDFQIAIAEQHYQGAVQLQGLTTIVLFVIGVASLTIVGLATTTVIRGVARPLHAMETAMRSLAEGDLAAEVPYVGRRDEVGKMAAALQVFKENGIRVAELAADEQQRQQLTAQRAEMMVGFQRIFDRAVEAGCNGDFSQSIEERFGDGEIDRIVENFNSLLETVNAGMTEAGSVLSALARMDLRARMEGRYQGAFARLKDDTNAVADQLSGIVGRLRTTSGTLKTATGEILAGANDLSERTTRQAAAIEETSAAMEQLSTTVIENARRADDANEKAKEASVTAENGGRVIQDANAAMERIQQSSAKISNIIGMIDDIAFQTNLLALNASVEAARAGDAGKGFAVVAVEVRRLAQSAAQASAEVKALIEQSTSEVEDGSRLVAEAAQGLLAMLGVVRSNGMLMEGIAEASREQSNAIGEVSTAIRQMDEMTQHNAALVEQTNAAIEQTETQANDLDQIVATFRLDDQAHAAPSGPLTRVRKAAQSYLAAGNAAISTDWSEM